MTSTRIPHTKGGTTTRDDGTDLGVPMAPPSADYVHQGPEDALDPNSRGDYRGRLGDANYQPHTSEAVSRSDRPRYDLAPEIRVVKQGATGPTGPTPPDGQDG